MNFTSGGGVCLHAQDDIMLCDGKRLNSNHALCHGPLVSHARIIHGPGHVGGLARDTCERAELFALKVVNFYFIFFQFTF